MVPVAALVVLVLPPCPPGGVAVEVRGLEPGPTAAFVEDLLAEPLPPSVTLCEGPARDALTVEVGDAEAVLSARLGASVARRSVTWRPGDESLLLAALAGELLRQLALFPAPAVEPERSRWWLGVSGAVSGSAAGDWFLGPELAVRWSRGGWGLVGGLGASWAPAREAPNGTVWSAGFTAVLRGLRVLFERNAFSVALEAGVRAGVLRGASRVLIAWEGVVTAEGGGAASFDAGPVRVTATVLLGATPRGVRWLDGATPVGGLSGLSASVSLGAGVRW